MAFFCCLATMLMPQALELGLFLPRALASPDAMAVNSSKEWTRKAADYAKLGKDRQAVECLEIALDLNPHNPEAQELFNRLKAGEPGPRAIKAADVKVPEKAEEARQLFERARMHLSKGDLHQAHNCLEIALELDEMNFEIKAELDKVVQRIKFERYRDTGGDPELANTVAAAPRERFHTVEKGDTLGKIAKKYLGSFKEYKKIADFNRMKPTSTLSVGQRIAIPPDGHEPGLFLSSASGQKPPKPSGGSVQAAPKVLPFGDGDPGQGIRVIREFESTSPAGPSGIGRPVARPPLGVDVSLAGGPPGSPAGQGKNLVSYDVIEVERPGPAPAIPARGNPAYAPGPAPESAGLRANSGWAVKSEGSDDGMRSPATSPREGPAGPSTPIAHVTGMAADGAERVPVIFYKPIPPLPPARVKKEYVEPRPVSATDYYDLASAQWKAGELEKAMDLYMKAVKLDPTYLTKGRTKLVDDAILMLKGTTPADPKSFAQLHYRLGAMYQKRGDFTESETEYQRAIELDPSFEEAWFSLGFVYEKTGRSDLAIGTYEKVNEIFASRDEIVDLATGRITALVDRGRDR